MPACVLVTSVTFNSLRPMDYSPLGSFIRGFSRQEYWSGLPCPPPGDVPNPVIEHASPALAGRFFTNSGT